MRTFFWFGLAVSAAAIIIIILGTWFINQDWDEVILLIKIVIGVFLTLFGCVALYSKAMRKRPFE